MAALRRACSLSLVAVAVAGPGAETDQCDETYTGDGASYRGCQTTTKSGRTCQRWNVQSPHEHSRTAARYPGFGLSSNYCRNPDGEDSIWCYTTDPDLRWEHCEPKKDECDETTWKASDKGESYRGCQTRTETGRHCQAWIAQSPHTHTVTPHKYQGKGLIGSYCRNPDGHHGLWCYTKDPKKRWEACKPMIKFHPGGGGGGDGATTTPPPTTDDGFGEHSGQKGWVDDHNHFRALHGAGKVTWDSDLAAKAVIHAKTMKDRDAMFHSDCYNDWPSSGENVAFGHGSSCGPRLYNGGFDQHCVMAMWYGEYYLWKGRGDWKTVPGIGHFTAIVWKGVDTIGCASNGRYYVCEYGSVNCREREKYGGASCYASTPAGLPNFNQGHCAGGACIQSLFNLSSSLEEVLEEPVAATAGLLAMGAGVTMLLAGAGLVARRLRAQARVTTDGDDQELLSTGLEM